MDDVMFFVDDGFLFLVTRAGKIYRYKNREGDR